MEASQPPVSNPTSPPPATPPVSNPTSPPPATPPASTPPATSTPPDAAPFTSNAPPATPPATSPPATSGPPTATPPASTPPVSSDPEDAKEDSSYDNWPAKGGSGDQAQPWDHEEHALKIENSGPILTSGSADSSVQDLGRRLGELGYPNSVSRGENPFGQVDESLMAAVYQFRSEYDVKEDPSGFTGGASQAGQQFAAAHIGPWTREAIYRASDREDK